MVHDTRLPPCHAKRPHSAGCPSTHWRPASASSQTTCSSVGPSSDTPGTARHWQQSPVYIIDGVNGVVEELSLNPLKNTAQVHHAEVLRDGQWRCGTLVLGPHSSVDLQKSLLDTQVYAVLRGTVTVITSSFEIQVGEGGQFVVRPQTVYTLKAGGFAAELVYSQLLSGSADTQLTNSYLMEFESEPEESITWAETPSNVDQHAAFLRRMQKDYVSRFRHSLDRAQYLGLMREETLQLVRSLEEEERRARGQLVVEEWVDYEAQSRAVIEDTQLAVRSEISRERFRGSILPWCTLGCNYCCKLQHELHKQVCIMAERECEILVAAQEAAAETLQAEEGVAWRRLQLDAWVSIRGQQQFESLRCLLWHEVEVRRLLLDLEEQRVALEMQHKMHLSEEYARFHNDSWALKNQVLEIGRLSDTMQLRENAMHRAVLDLHQEKEDSYRLLMISQEEGERTVLMKQVGDAKLKLICGQYDTRISGLEKRVHDLQRYKDTRQAEDAAIEQARREEEQQQLVTELEELRKARRKKAPRLVPPAVIESEACDKCGTK
eukprot:Sspe_Gene.92913::Locus_65666_Transcript_1_1_Confidence_1.000_Length_1710::g.92913::m.92913